MIRVLFISYIIIYSIFAVFVFVAYARIVPEEVKKVDQPWETALDLVLVAVGLAGMLLLLAEVQSNTVKFIWRPVSILLAATQLYGNLKGRFHLFRSGEAKRGDAEVGYADISTILFLLPSLCLNIYYAFR